MLKRVFTGGSILLPLIVLAGQGDYQRPTGLGGLIDDAKPMPVSEDVTTGMGQMGYMAYVREGRDAWPGVRFVARSGEWDLNEFGHIEAIVRNADGIPLKVTLRVENSGTAREKHWNEETFALGPGEETHLWTFFGYGHGMKKGYHLDP